MQNQELLGVYQKLRKQYDRLTSYLDELDQLLLEFEELLPDSGFEMNDLPDSQDLDNEN